MTTKVNKGEDPMDVWQTATNIYVALSLAELNALIDEADKALDGDSNDAEHDALYSVREQLADMSTDPERRR